MTILTMRVTIMKSVWGLVIFLLISDNLATHLGHLGPHLGHLRPHLGDLGPHLGHVGPHLGVRVTGPGPFFFTSEIQSFWT